MPFDQVQRPCHITAPYDIVVVDDEPEIVSFISTLLLDEGYAVRTATNGRQALAMLEHQPGMLLLDILMPVMGGVELLRRLQGQGTASFPIVAMSAGRMDLAALYALGVTEVIHKPFDLYHLLTCVERFAAVDPAMRSVGSAGHHRG